LAVLLPPPLRWGVTLGNTLLNVFYHAEVGYFTSKGVSISMSTHKLGVFQASPLGMRVVWHLGPKHLVWETVTLVHFFEVLPPLAGWLAGCLSQPVLYQND